MGAYAIKDGYIDQPDGPAYFIDDVTSERGIVFQPDVYPYAAELTVMAGLTTIVDVGCGRADKLAVIHAEHPDWRLVGVDYGPNIEWCRATYDWGEWLDLDLEAVRLVDCRDAVIVAADVIEHLRAPERLLDTIRRSDCRVAVLSTPERDLYYGPEHMGPPPNLCHMREWNSAEFRAFLEGEGLHVGYIGLTRSNDQGPGTNTILAAVTP